MFVCSVGAPTVCVGVKDYRFLGHGTGNVGQFCNDKFGDTLDYEHVRAEQKGKCEKLA